MKEKTPCHTKLCAFRCFRDLKFEIWGLEIKFVGKYFFLENYVTSEEAVSHNVLYYQPYYSFTNKAFMLIIILSNYQ